MGKISILAPIGTAMIGHREKIKGQMIYLRGLKLVLSNLVRGQSDWAGYMVIIARNFPFVNIDKNGI